MAFELNVSGLVASSLSLTAALAWNSAAQATISGLFPNPGGGSARAAIAYAVTVTVLIIIVFAVARHVEQEYGDKIKTAVAAPLELSKKMFSPSGDRDAYARPGEDGRRGAPPRIFEARDVAAERHGHR